MIGDSRLNPVFSAGQLDGQKITELDPESRLAGAGASSGDTIVSVNGRPINSPDASVELWCLLGTRGPLELELRRTTGETFTLSVRAAV